MNLNKAIVVGRLTHDPENRTTASGQSVANFSIATNRIWTDQSGNKQEAAEYHNVVVFGKLADICTQYLSKGRLVLIEGRIQTRSWEGKDGNKRYRTEIVAENMQMGPRGTASQAPSQEPQTPEEKIPDQEDIPVIEAEEPAPVEEREGVDLKNIPF